MIKHLLFSLFAIATLSSSTSAGLIPGQDAYIVRREALSMANGLTRPATANLVRRPTPGTYIPGILVVKTRVHHGIARQQVSIGGSMVNQDLAVLNVQEVSSAFMNLADADLSHELGMDRIYHVRYNEGIDPFDACARLMDNPDVEYAVPLYTHKLFYAPNDARYTQQPWMSTMRVDKAWDVTKGAATVIIAIIDSGTDWQHEDLAGNIWNNTKEIAGNGIDDDANGYVDDIRGWDFVGNISSADAQNGIARPDNDPRVSGTISDVTGHGTVVGGCASASTNNAKGVAGVGFNCKIIPIKCGSDNPNYGGILRGYEAIIYAADLGAHIINCSWGGAGLNPAGQDVIDYATSKGSLVIAASGNDGLDNDSYLQSPASFDGVLSVGSCSVSDVVSNFSNYGANVDVYAPGEGILSTYPNNQYRALSGTSFSSPLTSGIAGLVKSVHPDWTPQMIAAQIRGTVDPLNGISIDMKPDYWGRVNAERAVKVNASFSSGERMPGLVLSKTEINGSTSGKITSLNKTTIKFTIKNVLADAQNVTVVPRLMSSNVTYLGTVAIVLGSITKGGEVSGTFDVQLAQNYPWHAASVDIALSLNSGTYTNLEVLSIAVELPTSNAFDVLVQIPSSTFDLIDYTADGTLFGTGQIFGQRGMVLGNKSGAGGFVATPFVATAIEAMGANSVIMGGLSNTTPTISRSTNAGSSWSGINVSAFSASVEGIRMYDAQNGVFIGNPVAGKYGIGRTTNAGASWVTSTTSPLSTGTDRLIPRGVFFHGDAIFFATVNSKVLASLNKGQTWLQGSLSVAGASIVSIAFRDSTNGLLLYRTNSASDAPYRLASSTNGGANWKAGTTNLALGFTPARVDAGPSHFLLIGTNGAVVGSDNNGVNWQPILSQPAGTVVYAQAMTLDRPSIFMCGSAISLLQYRYSGPNGTKLPEFTTSQVGFGIMEPGQVRSRTATIKNTGTSDVNVSAYATLSEGTTPANVFTISSTPKDVVPAGGSISVPLRCTATDVGQYSGKLRVTSDGTPNIIEIILAALVNPPTSVQEDLFAMGPVTVGPNPASATLAITGYTPMQITLISLGGSIVHRYTVEPGTTAIDIRSIPAGAYQLVMIHGMGIRTVPISIIR